MANKKTTTSSKSKKRIYNPVTGTYYSIRVRSTIAGKKGTIIGRWSSIRKRRGKN